jgi:putative membrane protein
MKMKTCNFFKVSAFIMIFSVVASLSVKAQGKLSDPEVASVAVIANQNDIDFAAVAKEKSKNKEILKFAETMTNDHKAVIAQAVALVKKLGVTPKENSVGKEMQTNAQNTIKMLKSKNGKEFDKAYIDNEVAYHQAVIGAVETVLIPESENAELKALLTSIVPALKAHLAQAQMVQKNLK